MDLEGLQKSGAELSHAVVVGMMLDGSHHQPDSAPFLNHLFGISDLNYVNINTYVYVYICIHIYTYIYICIHICIYM